TRATLQFLHSTTGAFSFNQKARPGYSVTFAVNANGEVVNLAWTQSSGVIVAHRITPSTGRIERAEPPASNGPVSGARPITAPAPLAPPQSPQQYTLFPPIEGAGRDAVNSAEAEVHRLQFVLNPQTQDPAGFPRVFDGFNRDIAQARQAFWAEYPNGP